MVGVKEVGMLPNPLKGFCGYHWYLEGLRILQLMSAHFTCAFLTLKCGQKQSLSKFLVANTL